MYADTLFTTERMLKEKPDVVKKFVAATVHGWADAVAEPEAAARTTVKFGNKLEYGHELAMMKASIPLIKAGADAIGVSKQSEWETLQKMLIDAEFQKTRIDVAKGYTNDELPK